MRKTAALLFLIVTILIVLPSVSPSLRAERGSGGEVNHQLPTQTPTATPEFTEPEGCLEPPDDYTRINFGESVLNQRTVSMLEHAQILYGGPIDLTGRHLTQGSYNAGVVALSFGTHDGGGAVDISVRNLPIDYSVRYDDIEPLVQALRTAGFAAWYRDEKDGMTPHIHAIAIGDEELSYVAALQINGRYGYFRGFNALPQEDGVPIPDAHGGPVLCQWMLDLGYRDRSEETTVLQPPYTFSPDQQIYVNTILGDELNFRDAPGLSTTVIGKLQHETLLTVIDGPQSADGFRWWQVALEDGTIGWAADEVGGTLTLVP